MKSTDTKSTEVNSEAKSNKRELVQLKTKNKILSIDVLRLRNIKISGVIGGVGEKDKLSYSSLSYQLWNGKKLGYSDEMMCAAVIHAIAPENNLRTYLERKITYQRICY